MRRHSSPAFLFFAFYLLSQAPFAQEVQAGSLVPDSVINLPVSGSQSADPAPEALSISPAGVPQDSAFQNESIQLDAPESSFSDSAAVSSPGISDSALPGVSVPSAGLDSAAGPGSLPVSSADSFPPASADSTVSPVQEGPAVSRPPALASEDVPEPEDAPEPDEKKKPDPKKREKLFRESHINTIDEMKGRYKSPRKAMFMSLAVPGLGQAYVGHYIRSVFYFAAEIGLGISWRHYVVTKHDRQVRRYKQYADAHWSHRRYETGINDLLEVYDQPEKRDAVFLLRDVFCDAVYPETKNSNSSAALNTCKNFEDRSATRIMDYNELPHVIDIQPEPGVLNSNGKIDADSIAAVGAFRATYRDLQTFYELVGKHDEFVMGWDDMENLNPSDSAIWGESENRLTYRGMRAKASEYSRMQAWFLGGIVMNHLVSAIDAAIAARLNNKKLYQTDVMWYDRIRLQGFFVLENGLPVPTVLMELPF